MDIRIVAASRLSAFGVRFALCYLVLFAVFAADVLAGIVAFRYGHPAFTPFPLQLLHVFIPWLATHIGLQIVTFSNGSGDTTYDWLVTACDVVVSAVVAVVWLVAAPRPSTAVLYAWARALAKIVLAAMLLMYGLDKAIPAQFGVISPSRLSQPLGLL